MEGDTMAMRLRPGSVVVLEGLDATGKTTQLAQLRSWRWSPEPTFAHMPSGLTSLTTAIYSLTEIHSIKSPLARQLLHLACHAENMKQLAVGRDSSGLILDRWWWSTVAYGWYGAGLAESGFPEETFLSLIANIWTPIRADVIFVFSNPFKDDPLNLPTVRDGYRRLIQDAGDVAVEVPLGDPGTTSDIIRATLVERQLVTSDTNLC